MLVIEVQGGLVQIVSTSKRQRYILVDHDEQKVWVNAMSEKNNGKFKLPRGYKAIKE